MRVIKHVPGMSGKPAHMQDKTAIPRNSIGHHRYKRCPLMQRPERGNHPAMDQLLQNNRQLTIHVSHAV
jgi:hypothetical protein